MSEYVYTVLVADDDAEIRSALYIYLRNEGYRVLQAANGQEALQLLTDNEVHLIIMDLMMPKLDGTQAILHIRQTREIPIIILSAKTEDADIVLGLNIGADDYVTKPFKMLELLARIKSNLRRYVKFNNYKRDDDNDELTIRALSFNKKTRAITLDGRGIRLTPTEQGILLLLMENPGVVFSIERIYEHVWNEPFMNSENTVAVHIRRIREKIEINPKEPMYIKVVWGIGYKIDK